MLIDYEFLAIVAAAFFLAGIVKGGTGMGLPTVSVAIVTTAADLRIAVPILMFPSFAANIWQISRGGMVGGLLRRFWLINLSACIGIWFGTDILYSAAPDGLTIFLGVIVAGYALFDLFSISFAMPPHWEKPLAVPVGFAAGLVTGMTGTMLWFLMMYLQALRLDKDTFIKALGLSLLIGTAAWSISLVAQGAMTGPVTLASVVAVPFVLLGMAIGHWCRDRIPQRRFRSAVSTLLLLLGLNLIRVALT